MPVNGEPRDIILEYEWIYPEDNEPETEEDDDG